MIARHWSGDSDSAKKRSKSGIYSVQGKITIFGAEKMPKMWGKIVSAWQHHVHSVDLCKKDIHVIYGAADGNFSVEM